MESELNLIKVFTALFIILNLFILISGHIFLQDLFVSKSKIMDERDYYIKKEENIMLKLDVIKQSNVDLFSNIKQLNEKINLMKDQINGSTMGFKSSQEEQLFFQNKLANLLQENNYLKDKISFTNNKLKTQRVTQNKIVKVTSSPTISVKRTKHVRRITRSS